MDAAAKSLVRIERLNYLVGAILCMGAALRYPTPIALGVAVGAALTCLNFAVLSRLVSRWTRDAAQGATSNRILLVLPKMVVLMGAVMVALLLLPIDPIDFLVGFSIFLVSLTIETVYGALAPAAPDDTNDDGDAPASSDPPPQTPDEHKHG